jgi:hypothetical protein
LTLSRSLKTASGRLKKKEQLSLNSKMRYKLSQFPGLFQASLIRFVVRLNVNWNRPKANLFLKSNCR